MIWRWRTSLSGLVRLNRVCNSPSSPDAFSESPPRATDLRLSCGRNRSRRKDVPHGARASTVKTRLGWRVARVAAARKLGRIIFCVLQRGESW
jgi:hypothetical protein